MSAPEPEPLPGADVREATPLDERRRLARSELLLYLAMKADRTPRVAIRRYDD